MNDTPSLKETWSQASRTRKVAVGAIAVGVLAIVGSLLPGSDDEPAGAAAQPTPTATSSGKPTPSTPKPSKPATPAEKVQAAVEATDVDAPRVKLNSPQPGYIKITFKVGDNLSNHLIQIGLAHDVFDSARAIRDTEVPYKRLWFDGTFPLQDKYGKEYVGRVFHVQLKKSTVDRINFDNILVTTWEGLNRLADSFVILNPGLR